MGLFSLQKIMVLRCMRLDMMVPAVQNFVEGLLYLLFWFVILSAKNFSFPAQGLLILRLSINII